MGLMFVVDSLSWHALLRTHMVYARLTPADEGLFMCEMAVDPEVPGA